MPEKKGPTPFGTKAACHKQDDGWELTEAPQGPIYFFRGGGFDVCVWKCDTTELGKVSDTFLPQSWHMSCHRQFGFSAHLADAKDERTAKLMALSKVQERCRLGAYQASKAIMAVADAHNKRDATLPAFRDMPLGRPNRSAKCELCGALPTVPLTKLCGPCTFGDPTTANGNW